VKLVLTETWTSKSRNMYSEAQPSQLKPGLRGKPAIKGQSTVPS